MTEELTILDSADHLKSDQAIADFMCAALETKPWVSRTAFFDRGF